MMEGKFARRLSNDEYIDEIRIKIVPRFKTSDLSGDEWRTSARVQLLRKGEVLFDESVSNIETAAKWVPWLLVRGSEDGSIADLKGEHEYCMQPGCSEKAVGEYALKYEYDRAGHQIPIKNAVYVRRFCTRHLKRGDCGLEDADANYEVLSGPGPDRAAGYGEDVSESAVVYVKAEDLFK